MAFQLMDSQRVLLSVAFEDAAGNAATVDDAPVWTSSDEDILLVEAEADGMSAWATAVGPLGHAQVQLSADADLGAGTRALNGILEVDVIAGEAVVAVINPGDPEEKPAQA